LKNALLCRIIKKDRRFSFDVGNSSGLQGYLLVTIARRLIAKLHGEPWKGGMTKGSMFELFTIGHSVHPVDRFIELLKTHRVTALYDVRSSPYSRFVPQFNREPIKEEAARHRLAYLYLGAELGPRSADPTCYENGKVQYSRLAAREIFQRGLGRLRKGMETNRIALMCAEKDPLMFHRMILICRNLAGDDIGIRHILEDGSLEDNRDTEKRLMESWKIDPADLFSPEADQIQRAYDLQGEKIAYTLEG
jgi:hypothetical protein